MGSGRRLTAVKSGESITAYDISIDDVQRRDSISSRGSWMKRLSILPSSNNSPRSSVGPDSPSIQMSVGSAAPILSTPINSPTQLPPNKLVKRATSGRSSSDGSLVRTRSKSHLPTLRRPATSHQRSFTLQQQSQESSASREAPFETPTRQSQPTTLKKFHGSEPRSGWRQYFESRLTRITRDRSSGFSADGSLQNTQSTSRRVVQDANAKPTLIKPQLITPPKQSENVYFEDGYGLNSTYEDDADGLGETLASPVEPIEPQKRARRSLSMHFSSPSSWIPRSGSLRKRNDSEGGGKRYSSAPSSTLTTRSTTSAHGSRSRAIMDPTVYQRQTHTSAEHSSPGGDPFAASINSRTRNTSSPLPPLSRLSSFNIDLARSGLASSSSSAPRHSPSSSVPQTNTTSTSLTSTSHTSPHPSSNYFGVQPTRSSRTSELVDRNSTLVGSDNDTKGFVSGDDDEMDFQSDTVYDSLRSGATSSIRSHNVQLDAMFEESPPSITGHGRKKRLSIHEMLVNGGFQEEDTRIVEEDEGMPTPVKNSRSGTTDFDTPTRLRPAPNDHLTSSPPTFSLATRDLGRLSLDDEDDDEDWTRDEDEMDIGNLSPPSSMNSRKLSPSFRAALADVTHSGLSNGSLQTAERPKSTLFDWAEPSAEKSDFYGNSPRPKTANVKQGDSRGGRAVGRRGPGALHVRSQSVPVVPDVAGQREATKLTPKFGTWGLGAKGVSEDWDNDFEFDGLEEEDTEDSAMEHSGMLVPPAIQASQASVVGHVGQIREVCLLVEDLKRLRLLAKEKDLLEGKSAALWKEAEGIIALAAPDEEDEIMVSSGLPTPIIIEDDDDDKFHDEGFDAEDIGKPEKPVEVLGRYGQSTGLAYDGMKVRRKSVFSPEDDIFGSGALISHPSKEHLRPPSAATRQSSIRSASEVARSVMETMHQHRSTSDPMLGNLTSQASNKMPFDTTSLRDLVHRANVLTRTLSELIRKADGQVDSSDTATQRESSPAFTRVFTDPMQSPPKHLPRSQSNNSVLSGSIDDSPTRALGQRMQMMTVV